MKNYRILKSFKGSQTGHDCHEFEAGTEALLSDSLAEVVVKEGWAELIVPAPVPEPEPEPAPAPESEAQLEPELVPEPEPEPLADEEQPSEVVDGDVEARETKVDGPEETKPLDLTKLNKKQLVTYAKDALGLELDEAQKKEELLAGIKAHASVA